MRYVPDDAAMIHTCEAVIQHLRPKRGLDCQTFQEARDEIDRLKAEIEEYKKKTSDNDNATSPPTPTS